MPLEFAKLHIDCFTLIRSPLAKKGKTVILTTFPLLCFALFSSTKEVGPAAAQSSLVYP